MLRGLTGTVPGQLFFFNLKWFLWTLWAYYMDPGVEPPPSKLPTPTPTSYFTRRRARGEAPFCLFLYIFYIFCYHFISNDTGNSPNSSALLVAMAEGLEGDISRRARVIYRPAHCEFAHELVAKAACDPYPHAKLEGQARLCCTNCVQRLCDSVC